MQVFWKNFLLKKHIKTPQSHWKGRGSAVYNLFLLLSSHQISIFTDLCTKQTLNPFPDFIRVTFLESIQYFLNVFYGKRKFDLIPIQLFCCFQLYIKIRMKWLCFYFFHAFFDR